MSEVRRNPITAPDPYTQPQTGNAGNDVTLFTVSRQKMTSNHPEPSRKMDHPDLLIPLNPQASYLHVPDIPQYCL